MATVNVIGTFCGGNTGAHATLQLRVNSVLQATVRDLTFNEVQEPVTEEEKALFVRLFIKLHFVGKTPAQLRSDILTGFSATI